MTLSERANRVIKAASQKGLTLSTAESLTGGMICETLVSVPGASQVVAGGVCSYMTRVKSAVLGVPEDIIENCGVVSEACAKSMAAGARRLMAADMAVSATGVAGPSGGTPETPVGTVFIGLATEIGESAKEYRFTGSRQSVREQAAAAAIDILYSAITDERKAE